VTAFEDLMVIHESFHFLEKNWRESDGEKSFTEFPNQLWLVSEKYF